MGTLPQDRDAREMVAMAAMQSREDKDTAEEAANGTAEKEADRRKARYV